MTVEAVEIAAPLSFRNHIVKLASRSAVLLRKLKPVKNSRPCRRSWYAKVVMG